MNIRDIHCVDCTRQISDIEWRKYFGLTDMIMVNGFRPAWHCGCAGGCGSGGAYMELNGMQEPPPDRGAA